MFIKLYLNNLAFGRKAKKRSIKKAESDQIFHNFITQWRRLFIMKTTVAQLVKKFPAFYGTRTNITVFTTAPHLSLSWTTWIQSTSSNSISIRSISILSHLRLDLSSDLLPSGFPRQICRIHLGNTVICRHTERDYVSEWRERRQYKSSGTAAIF
jgi:hypothetical protein